MVFRLTGDDTQIYLTKDRLCASHRRWRRSSRGRRPPPRRTARTPRCSPMIPPRRRGSCDRPASSDAAVAWSFHQSFACSSDGEGRNVRRAVSRRRLQAGDRRTFRPSPSSVPACGGRSPAGFRAWRTWGCGGAGGSPAVVRSCFSVPAVGGGGCVSRSSAPLSSCGLVF